MKRRQEGESLIDRLERLARGATPGPWAVRYYHGEPDRVVEIYAPDDNDKIICETDHGAYNPKRPTAEYIAAVAPPTVLLLIDRCRAAEAGASQSCASEEVCAEIGEVSIEAKHCKPPWTVVGDGEKPIAIVPAGRSGDVVALKDTTYEAAERLANCANAGENDRFERALAQLEDLKNALSAASAQDSSKGALINCIRRQGRILAKQRHQIEGQAEQIEKLQRSALRDARRQVIEQLEGIADRSSWRRVLYEAAETLRGGAHSSTEQEDRAAGQERLNDLLAENKRLRDERNTAARADIDGAWIWSDTDPNALDELSSDAPVKMTARQLRELIEDVSAPRAEPVCFEQWRAIADLRPDYKMDDLHGNSNAATVAHRCLLAIAGQGQGTEGA